MIRLWLRDKENKKIKKVVFIVYYKFSETAVSENERMQKMTTVTVMNLATRKKLLFVNMSPKKAVVNAYRQMTKKDYNTWESPHYRLPIFESKRCISCGNWVVYKDGRSF